MSFEPSQKSEAMEGALTRLTGIDRRKSIREMKCATCGDTVTRESFKDSLSQKEFTISGMCQTCQDKIWG